MTKEEIEKDKSVTEHPQRYGGDGAYECIKVLRSRLGEEQYKGFLRGTCIKYLCRLGKKDNNVQELKKAKFYLEKLIEIESDQCKKQYKEFVEDSSVKPVCACCGEKILDDTFATYHGLPYHYDCLGPIIKANEEMV